MNRHTQALRSPAGAAGVLAVAAGLVLAGCGGSSGPSGSAGSTGSAGSSGSAAAASSSSSSSSAGSGGGSVTTSDTVPFPVGVGDTWTYKTTFGRTVNKQIAVKSVAGGQQVTMASTITTDGTTQHNATYYVVHPDGSISLPFSQFNSTGSGGTVKLISGNVIWPSASQLSSGQAYHDTLLIEIKSSGINQKVTAHLTVKGGGTQSVTVPAGTYSATVINMTMAEKVEGFKVSSVVRTWLASGVGPVKTEVILTEAGHQIVAAKDELISFKAG